MPPTIERVTDRGSLEQVEALETEHLAWVNTQLGADGIGLDVGAVLARDLADLEAHFLPQGALLIAAREMGYARVLLESPCSWAGAHAVHRAHGLTAVDPHLESEVPGHLREYWIRLGRDLRPDGRECCAAVRRWCGAWDSNPEPAD